MESSAVQSLVKTPVWGPAPPRAGRPEVFPYPASSQVEGRQEQFGCILGTIYFQIKKSIQTNLRKKKRGVICDLNAKKKKKTEIQTNLRPKKEKKEYYKKNN